MHLPIMQLHLVPTLRPLLLLLRMFVMMLLLLFSIVSVSDYVVIDVDGAFADDVVVAAAFAALFHPPES
jgi:hypothetical protein